jgi:DNA repair protein SbcD/Mre11
MIRFIHTADIHFGMENYGKIDPVTGIHSRLLDFVYAFDFCVDTAIAAQADFFLFCGDAYKTHHPSQTQQKMLLQAFLRLHKASIPVVIIIGNHDHPLSFGKAHALDIFGQLPCDGFYVLSKPQVLHLRTKSGPVSIVGIPWPTRNTISVANEYLTKSASEITQYIAKMVSKLIASFAAQLPPDIPAVLAGHLTVSSGIFSGSEKRAIYGTDPLFFISDLAIAPFDYVALGHLHRYQDLNPTGYPAIVYSGSIERIDFGERKEDKGFCMVTIERKGVTRHEFVKGPARPFVQIDVPLKAGQTQTEQIVHKIAQYDIYNAVVKIVYYLAPNTKDVVDKQAIIRVCSAAHHIAAIACHAQPVVRDRRAYDVHLSADPVSMLTRYLEGKNISSERINDLVQKAMTLAEEDQLPKKE